MLAIERSMQNPLHVSQRLYRTLTQPAREENVIASAFPHSARFRASGLCRAYNAWHRHRCFRPLPAEAIAERARAFVGSANLSWQAVDGDVVVRGARLLLAPPR
jgi:hypothetical protein